MWNTSIYTFLSPLIPCYSLLFSCYETGTVFAKSFHFSSKEAKDGTLADVNHLQSTLGVTSIECRGDFDDMNDKIFDEVISPLNQTKKYKFKCVVLFFLFHGGQDVKGEYLSLDNDNKMYTQHILNRLTKTACPALLTQIPLLLFFRCCRGLARNSLQAPEATLSSPTTGIPAVSDRLVVWNTPRGYVTTGGRNEGNEPTKFIKTICDGFKEGWNVSKILRKLHEQAESPNLSLIHI